MAFDQADFQLYTFFRSTSTARVRTAARLKKIPLSFIYVNVRKNEQFDRTFMSLNPNGTVPVLTVTPKSRDDNEGFCSSFSIRQSVPILEFFEEAFPDRTLLLPPVTDLAGRAHVRDLVNLVACDIQPPTNRRILLRVQEIGGSLEAWAFKIMGEGLQAFEDMARPLAGKYSYGDQLTMADVVLAPAVENAVRYGVDLDTLPTVKRVFQAIRQLDEFRAADWRHQEDTPEEEIRL
jgi:maleylacetoacetate isomerase